MIRPLVYALLLVVLTGCGVLNPKPPGPAELPLTQVWALTLGGNGDNLAINSALGPDGAVYVASDEQFDDPATNFLRLYAITPDGQATGVTLADQADTELRNAAAARGWPVCNSRVDLQQGAIVVSGGGVYLSTMYPKDPAACRALIGFANYNALMRYDAKTLKRTMLTFISGDESPFNGDPARSVARMSLTATGTDAARMVGVWAASPSSFGQPVFGQLSPDGTWNAADPAVKYPNRPDWGFRQAVTAPDGGAYAIASGPTDGWVLARLSPSGDVLWQAKLWDFFDSADVGQITPAPGDVVFVSGVNRDGTPVAGNTPPPTNSPDGGVPFVARFDQGKLTWIFFVPDIGNVDVAVAYDPAANEVYAVVGWRFYFLDAKTGEVLPKTYITSNGQKTPLDFLILDPEYSKRQSSRFYQLYLVGDDLVGVGKTWLTDAKRYAIYVVRYRRQ